MTRQKQRVHKDLQGLYEESPIGLCSLDTNLRYIHINDWLAAINGLPVEAHLGRTIREVLPDVAAGVEQQLRKVIETGDPLIDGRVEAETPAQPGVVRAFHHSYYPNRSEDGRIVGVSCVVADITELKWAEARGKASRDLLSALSRVQSQFIADADLRTVFDNLLKELLLLTQSKYGFIGEIILFTAEGKPYLKTHAISDIAWNEKTRALFDQLAPNLEFYNLQTLFGSVITSGRPVIANHPAEDPRRGGLPQGHPPLNAFLGLPFYQGEKLVGMVGIANRPGGYDDAIVEYLEPFLSTCASLIEAHRSHQRRGMAEAALRESEERFRQMAEKIREVFWMTTPDKSEMLYVSPAYEEIWGRTCHSLYKEPRAWLDAIHPDDRPRVMAAAHEKQVGGVYDEEYRIVRTDGAVRWIRDRGFPITDHTGQVYRIAGIAEDITGRRRVDDALRERERQLRQLLEEREQMSRDLHDGIIQSIYAVGLGLDECRRLIPHDATASDERVGEAIANLNLVIREIRQYLTGPQPMKMNGQEFKSAMTSLAERIGNGGTPHFSLDIDEAAAGQVTAEEAPHLLYIAREALSNCFRHSRARRVVVSLQTHDGGVRLQVEDDGVGFEVQAPDTRGYGLRNIEARAVMMHAQLQIESERGRGTRVMLHVPKERRGVSAQTPTCG